MDYITRQPRDLNATETRLLHTIEIEGWWSVDPRCQTFEQQEALHFLWKSGYIEMASYGGWKVKRHMQQPTDIERITTVLEAAGVTPRKPVIQVTSGAFLRPGTRPSFAIVLPLGAKMPVEVSELFAEGVFCSGDFYVFQLREG